jgi:hypothetical protein
MPNFKICILKSHTPATELKLPYFIKYGVHFFPKNDDEILPAHNTWKVIEKGLKIKLIM